jgi:hypothetical protein
LNKLNESLSSFLGHDETVHPLAKVLSHAHKVSRISYNEIEKIINDNPEDVVLTGYEWRLLIPIKSARETLDWESKILLLNPDEMYKMPNVIKYLVKNAEKTGEWNPDYAVAEVFKKMGEPNWEKMSTLVKKLEENAENGKVNAIQIRGICEKLSLKERTGSLIAELKGSGIISPKLSSFAEVFKAKAPIYELNPSLFVAKHRK